MWVYTEEHVQFLVGGDAWGYNRVRERERDDIREACSWLYVKVTHIPMKCTDCYR